MKRRFRLSSSSDYQRVRRKGKSYAHPLIVLIVLPNELEKSRFAVSAGRSVGNAVQRNRAKRLLRESLRPHIPDITSGRDILLLARHAILEASFQEIQAALNVLLRRSHLLENEQIE
ncbi:MAG: ribonuclease P protein component [Omnitrophica WOR_2 bacterium]